MNQSKYGGENTFLGTFQKVPFNAGHVRLAFDTDSVTWAEDLDSELLMTFRSVVCWTNGTSNNSSVSSGIKSGSAGSGLDV